jgi:hypothetical protein
MAHFAELDENNVVLRVLVTDNNDPNGDEGYQWLVDNLGGTWVQTSYNGNFRNRFAGMGFTYDPERDAFIQPKPFDSWILNNETLEWDSPIPKPEGPHTWDEESLSWLEVEEV